MEITKWVVTGRSKSLTFNVSKYSDANVLKIIRIQNVTIDNIIKSWGIK